MNRSSVAQYFCTALGFGYGLIPGRATAATDLPTGAEVSPVDWTAFAACRPPRRGSVQLPYGLQVRELQGVGLPQFGGLPRKPFSGGDQALGHPAPSAMFQNSRSRRTIRSQAASVPGESVAWTSKPAT